MDRLLASPRYGERWGRYWLDVARYADTAGDNADVPIPEMYRYRNYVADSFNADKPYDRFVREQIAGDLLAAGEYQNASKNERRDMTVATGFIAISRRFGTQPRSSRRPRATRRGWVVRLAQRQVARHLRAAGAVDRHSRRDPRPPGPRHQHLYQRRTQTAQQHRSDALPLSLIHI